jgi:hypothetical protein
MDQQRIGVTALANRESLPRPYRDNVHAQARRRAKDREDVAK